MYVVSLHITLIQQTSKSSRESGGGRHIGHLETRLQSKISAITKIIQMLSVPDWQLAKLK